MLADSYHLRSDLARVCLPNPAGQTQRALAWANSICVLFLVVAISGVRPRLPSPKAVPPLEQPIPVIIQPLPPPPPPKEVQVAKEESTDEQAAAPRVVVVTLNSPAINFAVPTIGNVIAPNAIAQAPPVAPLQAKPAAVRAEPKSIGSTGQGGDRPQPPYPEMALQYGQQGTVILLLTVTDSGLVESAKIQETSGSAILDHSAADFVKRHWIVPPGASGRLFIATISYKIQND